MPDPDFRPAPPPTGGQSTSPTPIPVTQPDPPPSQEPVAPTPTPQAPTPLPELPSEPETTEPPKMVVGSGKAKFPKKLFIGLLILILIGGGAAAYFKFKPKHSSTTQQAANAKKDIAKFTYGVVAGPLNTFSPNNGTNVDEFAINQQVFEGLVIYRDKKIVPNLATSWTNPDESTWVFTLKSNVKFHTGRAMTADDVKASIDTLKKTDTGQIYSSTIKSVETVGTDKVKITTDGPDPVLLNKLVFLFIGDSKSTDKNSPVNGTGPYTLKPGAQPSEKETDLVAFDDYQGGRPYIRELDFKVIDQDDAMAAALKKGEVNLASFSDNSVSDPLKTQFEPFYIDDPTVFGLHLNTGRPGPLANAKVREAIYEAIDVDTLLKNIGLTGTIQDQLVVPDIPGYNRDIKRPAYNTDHAKQLLKDAGYPNGFTMGFSYLQTVTLLQKVSDELTRQLKSVGITIKPGPVAKAGTGINTSGTVDSFFQGYSSDILDLSDVISSTFQNKNYNNKQINSVVDQANKTFDPAKRLDLLKQISKQYMDDVAYIPMYSTQAPYILDKSYVIPVDIPATSYPGVYFWRVYQK